MTSMMLPPSITPKAATLLATLLACSGCAGLVDAEVARQMAGAAAANPAAIIAARADFASDEVAAVTVNGRSVAVAVGPGRSSTLHLPTADALALFGPLAAQSERRGEWPGAQRATERIGPVTVRGHRALASLSFAGGNRIAPVEWFARESAGGSVGQVGPFGVPATLVVFRLRGAQPGERRFTLPLDEEANGWGIASTSLFFAGQQVRFAFAPHFATSVASAAAGGVIARAQGGRYTGPPQPVLINHGVDRPARPVGLDRPLVLGPVMLASLLVRTLDYGAPQGISDQIDGEGGPADILVTARTDRQAPQYIVYIGADALDHCSSISFDKVTMTVSLSCAHP